jgi:Kef-type K+ transport system membrane component KefB
MGLAPIVGAFAAGLILERVHYTDFVHRDERTLEELIQPITSFLVPVFFVIMGMRTDLRAFADSSVLLLALAITTVAILGKLVCAFGVLGGVADRLTVGLGMIPRGEVGLIFANIGLGLTIGDTPVVSPHEFSALVVMVILTTMVTPPLLKWSLARELVAHST